MKEPIKSGDLAEIIAGELGTQGPNVGKQVRVGLLQGEHSVYGRIWRVHGEGLTSEYGATGNEMDCAQEWLRKIDPPEGPAQSEKRKEELTA